MIKKSISKISLSIAMILAAPLSSYAEEISHFKHFKAPEQYKPDTHASVFAIRNGLDSSIQQPLWAKFILPKGVNTKIQSVKWYGIIRTTHFPLQGDALDQDPLSVEERLLRDGNKHLEILKSLDYQVKIRNGASPNIKNKGIDIPTLGDNMTFVGKPKVKYLQNWLINVPADSDLSQQPSNTLVGPHLPSPDTQPVRVYLFEFSANLQDASANDQAFVSVNPMIRKGLIDATSINWSYVVPDVELGDVRYSEREQTNPNNEPMTLTSALVLNDARAFPFKARGGQEYSASIGIFDDVLEDTPTLNMVTALSQQALVNQLENKNSDLQQEKRTLLVEKQNLQTSLNNEQTQKNLQIGKVNELKVSNKRLLETVRRVENRNADLYRTRNQHQDRINELKAETAFGFQLKDKPSGQCLEAANGQFHNGNNVRINACNNSKAQRWTWNAVNFQIRSVWGNKCLDTQGSQQNNGNIIIYDCHNPDHPHVINQKFNIIDGKIRLIANPNIVLHTNGNWKGANVSLYQHHGGANQIWTKTAK
ncbi:MAG: ricin-type beta-trefoil lectin domain protein [Parashewanella sp.]